MSTELIITLVCLTLLTLGALMVLGFRNSIVSGKNLVKRAWADVIAYQRKKLVLIPDLEKQLKEYGAYEGKLLTGLTELRTQVSSLREDAPDVSQLQAVQKRTQKLLGAIQVAVEAYPQLKASGLYQSLMRELAEAEENIAAAIVVFNCTVQEFNDLIQRIPGQWVNGWLNKESPVAEFSDSAAESEFEYKPNL
jgi:LemA protein